MEWLWTKLKAGRVKLTIYKIRLSLLWQQPHHAFQLYRLLKRWKLLFKKNFRLKILKIPLWISRYHALCKASLEFVNRLREFFYLLYKDLNWQWKNIFNLEQRELWIEKHKLFPKGFYLDNGIEIIKYYQLNKTRNESDLYKFYGSLR